MKILKWCVLVVCLCFLMSCSSKRVTFYDESGNVTSIVETITNEKAYYDSNEKVKTQNNTPQLFAEISQGEGKPPIKLYLPQRDRPMAIPQYKNQVVGPATQLLGRGILGATVYGGLKAAFDASKADSTTIQGDGNTLSIDKSRSVNTDVLSVDDGSNFTQGSHNPKTTTSTVTDDHSAVDNSVRDDHRSLDVSFPGPVAE